MKRLALIPLLALPALAAEPNTLTEEETEAGFVLLFDGETTDGWRNYKKDTVDPKWRVVDGALTLAGKGGGDLISEEKFEDFDFRFEFKIAPDGNSGIMWHVAEIDGPPFKTGPEYQILDSTATKGYANERRKGNVAGAFYDLVPAKPELFKGANEWNTGRIVIDGDKITLYLNGEVTADVDTSTAEWKEMLANSKFANWEKFNQMEKGHLCFQDHGNPVAFRSLRVRRLP